MASDQASSLLLLLQEHLVQLDGARLDRALAGSLDAIARQQVKTSQVGQFLALKPAHYCSADQILSTKASLLPS